MNVPFSYEGAYKALIPSTALLSKPLVHPCSLNPTLMLQLHSKSIFYFYTVWHVCPLSSSTTLHLQDVKTMLLE